LPNQTENRRADSTKDRRGVNVETVVTRGPGGKSHETQPKPPPLGSLPARLRNKG